MKTITVDCRPCMYCGVASTVEMPYESYKLWHDGAFIQRAWPTASAGVRELLISGTHPECWDNMLGDDDEE